jgi:hypothetical protein
MSDENPIKCKCIECGKTWTKGDQGDNETMCLRCEQVDTHYENDIPYDDSDTE